MRNNTSAVFVWSLSLDKDIRFNTNISIINKDIIILIIIIIIKDIIILIIIIIIIIKDIIILILFIMYY